MSNCVFREKLVRMKEILNDAATYARSLADSEEEFQKLRTEWLQHPRYKHFMPKVLKDNRNLGEFRTFSQKDRGYKERREVVKGLFDAVLNELEIDEGSPADILVSGKLTIVDSDHIKEAWQKALDRRTTDPEGAITIARTLLESVCKHILEDFDEKVDNKSDLPDLYRAASKQLNLSPEQHTEQIFKQILNGCNSVITGLGALRNKHSDAHGKTRQAVKVSERHAELAVNLAGSMALFLVSTFEQRKKIETK